MPSPNVMIVEDELDIAQLMKIQLEAAGFGVRIFQRGLPALLEAESSPPHVILLDIMLPDGDGLELYRLIRARPKLANSRVIFVTARNAEADRVAGLELGADDYVVKPFSPRELVARIKAVIRRTQPEAAPARLKFGSLQIDLDAMVVYVRGEPVYTTTTEFRLLEALVRSAGRVVSRQRLLDLIWGSSRNVDTRSVDVYISRLRDKIELDPANPHFLQTVRGVGYRFVPHTSDEPGVEDELTADSHF